jgi:hypothetical protein
MGLLGTLVGLSGLPPQTLLQKKLDTIFGAFAHFICFAL